jgi:hypothetical protein
MAIANSDKRAVEKQTETKVDHVMFEYIATINDA